MLKNTISRLFFSGRSKSVSSFMRKKLLNIFWILGFQYRNHFSIFIISGVPTPLVVMIIKAEKPVSQRPDIIFIF